MSGNFVKIFFYWCACLCLHMHVCVCCVSVCKHTHATVCIWNSEETLGCWYMCSIQFETRSPCCLLLCHLCQARWYRSFRDFPDLLPLSLQYHRDYRHVPLFLSSQVFLVLNTKPQTLMASTLPTDPSPQLSLQYF